MLKITICSLVCVYEYAYSISLWYLLFWKLLLTSQNTQTKNLGLSPCKRKDPSFLRGVLLRCDEQQGWALQVMEMSDPSTQPALPQACPHGGAQPVGALPSGAPRFDAREGRARCPRTMVSLLGDVQSSPGG